MGRESKARRKDAVSAPAKRRELTHSDLERASGFQQQCIGSIENAVHLAAPARVDSHLSTAQAKYVEDACESIKQFDEATGKTLLPLLVEIPERGEGDGLSWKGLKGLRDMLVHKFYAVRVDAVWDTATKGLPIVSDLLKCLFIDNQIHDIRRNRETRTFFRHPHIIANLKLSEPDDPFEPGKFLIIAAYDRTAGWLLFRVGRSRDNKAHACIDGGWPDELDQPLRVSLLRYTSDPWLFQLHVKIGLGH